MTNETTPIEVQAHLHQQYFLGLQLMVSVEEGKDVVGDWIFRLFRQQHADKFLSSFNKLVETGEELVRMLLTEQAEDPVAHDIFAFFNRHHQLQSEKVLLVKMRLHLDRCRFIGHDADVPSMLLGQVTSKEHLHHDQ